MTDDRCDTFPGFGFICLPKGYVPCYGPGTPASEVIALCKEALDCSLDRCPASGSTRTCAGKCASWQGTCRTQPPTRACSAEDNTCYQFTDGCLPDDYRDCNRIPPYPGPLYALCTGQPLDARVPDGPPPPTWVTVAKGMFASGSPLDEPCRMANEDRHRVTLTHDFEIQTTEVTEGQYLSLMGLAGTGSSCGSTCPAHNITWNEAAAYCNALSQQAGTAPCYACTGGGVTTVCQEEAAYSGQKIYDCPGYRLPTEAEWEHAYRAGTTTAYFSGTNDPTRCTSCSSSDANADSIGWYCANSGNALQPVGQKKPNAWGLHDMAGNVWEWCHDRYQESPGSTPVTDPWGASSGTDRVLRGGSWIDPASRMRAASRVGRRPGKLGHTHGFRCVKSVTP